MLRTSAHGMASADSYESKLICLRSYSNIKMYKSTLSCRTFCACYTFAPKQGIDLSQLLRSDRGMSDSFPLFLRYWLLRAPIAVLVTVLMLFILSACGPRAAILTFGGETMGTTYNVTAIDASGDLDVKEIEAAIAAALRDVNTSMNNWDPASEISRFNASQSTEPVAISPQLAYVMAAAQQVHRASQGQFDATLGPLIELWGFGARNAQSPVPSDAAITQALGKVGQARVLTLGEGTMQKADPDTSVYLAAIAKGHGVDRIAEAIEAFGIKDYLVEIGGDLVARGENPQGEPWRIGIEQPIEGGREIEQVVHISGFGMATSGDYRNYFEEDGVRYSHIIDAQTGRPITHTTASVTVLAENAMLADAWATALLALGHERGMEISQANGLAAYFIFREAGLHEPKFTSLANAQFQTLLKTGEE